MFAMFILHHVLNFRFAASLTKGKYAPSRTLLTVMDLLLFADMLALMISAVMLSRHVFGFLGIGAGFSFARTMHLIASYWGLVLMPVHIGFHVQGAINKIQKAIPNGQRNAFRTISRVLCVGISAYDKEMAQEAEFGADSIGDSIQRNRTSKKKRDRCDRQWKTIGASLTKEQFFVTI